MRDSIRSFQNNNPLNDTKRVFGEGYMAPEILKRYKEGMSQLLCTLATTSIMTSNFVTSDDDYYYYCYYYYYYYLYAIYAKYFISNY